MKKMIRFSAYLLLIVSGMGLVLQALGIRMNTSASIPKGIYRITQSNPIENNQLKGAYVIFCPARSSVFKEALARGYIGHGLCPGGFGYLMKKVVAVEGDSISSTEAGVYINSELLPHSLPKPKDGLNRRLSQWRIRNYKLKSNEVLTMTNQSELSFDGRYYGLIQVKQIKGIVTSVFTW